MIVLALVFLAVLPLAADGERVACKRDFDVLLIEPGQFRIDVEFLIGLADVEPGATCPPTTPVTENSRMSLKRSLISWRSVWNGSRDGSAGVPPRDERGVRDGMTCLHG